MNLSERRAMTLRHERDALLDEFRDWRGVSNARRASLAKHHSQIRRVTGVLERFLVDAPVGRDAFEDTDRLLACLLFAQRTWAYFRGKFAQHTASVLQDTLKCTDEFAWECYAPARQRALQAGLIRAGQLKEPPLTFFSSAAAPFIQRRETVFEAEGITSAEAAEFDLELKLLPIPVIGVPWHHVKHLPSAVVVAHEVGHAVEADFNAAEVIDRRLADLAEVDARRRPAWQAWREELFADVYATLCAGPAYVIALTDYLVGPAADVVNEWVNSADWTTNLTGSRPYPTRSLRLEFNLAVLEQLDLPDVGVRQAWASAYPPSTWGQFAAFRADVGDVASVFLETPLPALGGTRIRNVICTTPADWQEITRKARRLIATGPGVPPRKRGEEDDTPLFREWLAAATWAYGSDPEAYAESRGARLLAGALIEAIPGDTRAAAGRTREEQKALRAAQEALRVAQDEADRAMAQTLLARVLAGGG
jgi:hypothetical protein